MAAPFLPPWLSSTPSVALTLSPSAAPPPSSNLQMEKRAAFELAECCRELEEGQRAWAAHKKEAAWRLRRVELQLEAEKACRRREAMDEVEAKVRKLREEQAAVIDRIDADYKEQLAALRRDAEAKEQKMAEHWAAKHARLSRLLEQLGSSRRRVV